MKHILAALGFCLAGLATTAYGAPLDSINFGFGATNTGTTTEEFSYSFPMSSGFKSIDLPAGTYDVSATFGITLTSGGDDTATFSLPDGTPAYMLSSINGKDAGVDIGTATENVTNGTEVFNFTPETSQFVLSSTGTTMSITTTFDLSPGDSASFSGSFQINAVPEPTGFALGLLAVGAFTGLAIRARRTRA